MRWHILAIILVGTVALAIAGAGCGFQPLYGSATTAADGARLSDVMSTVNITPVPGRVGQKVRNELIFLGSGGGYVPEPKYRLEIAIKENEVKQLVQITGDARGASLVLTASFKLFDSANGKPLFQGNAISRASLNRYQEVFADARARYDAENRAAHQIAESINTQVAAFFAKTG